MTTKIAQYRLEDDTILIGDIIPSKDEFVAVRFHSFIAQGSNKQMPLKHSQTRAIEQGDVRLKINNKINM